MQGISIWAYLFSTEEKGAIMKSMCKDGFIFQDRMIKLVGMREIISADILAFYHGELSQKCQLENLAIICGSIKRHSSASVKLVFCDSASKDIPPEIYKRIIRAKGVRAGLFEDDVVFTSDMGFSDGFPREFMKSLYTLSNLYISAHEPNIEDILQAAAAGNFVIVTDSGRKIRALCENIGAYILRSDEDTDSAAGAIYSVIKNDRSCSAKSYIRKNLL